MWLDKYAATPEIKKMKRPQYQSLNKISNNHSLSPKRNPKWLDDQGLNAEKATTELCPPNPNEFEIAGKHMKN